MINNRLVTKVAEQTGETKELVEAVERSITSFVRDMMAARDLRGIKLPYFGKFIVKPERLNYVKEEDRQHYVDYWQAKRDKFRLDKLNSEGLSDRADSKEASGDM